jgi:hypothetical protein
MVKNIDQFREGRRKRKLGIPATRLAGHTHSRESQLPIARKNGAYAGTLAGAAGGFGDGFATAGPLDGEGLLGPLPPESDILSDSPQ